MHPSFVGTMFALTATAAPSGSAVDDFFATLQRPAVLEDVAALVDLSDGVNLEIDYSLRDVGVVSIAVHEGDDGSGLGLVNVGDAVVAEARFVDGAVDRQTADFTGLGPAQAQAVAASVVQVWHEDAVLAAFADAAAVSAGSCPYKCGLAGVIAGGAVGVATIGACAFILKVGGACKAGGAWAGALVGTWVAGSCR